MIGMAAGALGGMMGGGGGGGMPSPSNSSSAESSASGNTWGSMGDLNYKGNMSKSSDWPMVIVAGAVIVAAALIYSGQRK